MQFRSFTFALLVCAIVSCSRCQQGADHAPQGVPQCAPGCSISYLADRHCDPECFNERCDWDAGDCDGQLRVRKTVVVDPATFKADSVGYEIAGPGNQHVPITMEAGRRKLGVDEWSRRRKHDWKSLLNNADEGLTPASEHSQYFVNVASDLPAFEVDL